MGYYKRTRPKEQGADWVWILDHTSQLGVQKWLVLLGIRLSALPPPGTCLRHEPVEPMALEPVQTSTGDVIDQQVTNAVAHMGVPRESLSDGGSDLQAGSAQFQQAPPETRALYDSKHKTALGLKHELAAEVRWQAFPQQAAQTKQRVQQTPLAFLAPPPQRRKARYRNVDLLIRWGTKVLAYRAQPRPSGEGAVRGAQLTAAYGWVPEFQEPLQSGRELWQIVEITGTVGEEPGAVSWLCFRADPTRAPIGPHRARPARRPGRTRLCRNGSGQSGPSRTFAREQGGD